MRHLTLILGAMMAMTLWVPSVFAGTDTLTSKTISLIRVDNAATWSIKLTGVTAVNDLTSSNCTPWAPLQDSINVEYAETYSDEFLSIAQSAMLSGRTVTVEATGCYNYAPWGTYYKIKSIALE